MLPVWLTALLALWLTGLLVAWIAWAMNQIEEGKKK
jgi:hypothetical protein